MGWGLIYGSRIAPSWRCDIAKALIRWHASLSGSVSDPPGASPLNEVDDPSAAERSRDAMRTAVGLAACFAAIALPWVSPFSGGPSAQVVPWLVSLFAGVILCATVGMRRLPLTMLAAAAALLAWGLVRGHGGLDSLALAGGIGLVLLSTSAGASLVGRENGLRTVAWALVAAAAVNAVIALAQHQGFLQEGSQWFSASLPGEAEGNLRQRNLLASHLSLGMIALAWLFARGLRFAATLPLVLLLAVASAASTSRTGLLQLLLLAGFAMALPGPRRGQRMGLCVTGLGAYALATFGLPWLLEVRGLQAGSLLQRLADMPACSSRTVLWSNVLTLVERRPWFGWGWGELDYAHYAVPVDGTRFCDILDNAHNLPLHLAVELGVPAAAAVVLGVAVALWRASPWRETDGDRRFAWAVLAALALHSLVEYPLWYGPFQIAAGLALGILYARRQPAVWVGTRWALTAAVLALGSYASWDFWRVGQIYLPAQSRSPVYAEDTIARIGHSWIFRDQVRFATLTTSTLTPQNAEEMNQLAREMLHFSPEPRVIERVIESAKLLGRQDEAAQDMRRYQAAFPKEYREWLRQQDRGQSAAGQAGA